MGLVVGLAILDVIVTPGKDVLRVRRVANAKLSLGDENEIGLEIENQRLQRVRGRITENAPPHLQLRNLSWAFSLGPGESQSFSWMLRPVERGEYVFETVSLKVNGLLGFSFRVFHLPLPQVLKVYPSYLQVRNYQLQTKRSNQAVLGKKQQKRYGEGREFESLREYTPDDEYRKINWKATARRGKPIVTQYRIERNQNVILLLDAGRMMRTKVDNMTKLDHAINAALMLAYICVYKEDNVGLMVFNSKIDTFLPPRRGKAQLNLINEILYKVKIEFAEPNYAEAFHYLKRKVSRRSLVVLITDLIDERASQVLIHEFTRLYPQHLPLCITLKDLNVEKLALQVPESTQDMLEMGVAQLLMEERFKALRFLTQNGVLTLDTHPGQLTADAINKYLEIKARSLI